jgi:hypothetical protein
MLELKEMKCSYFMSSWGKSLSVLIRNCQQNNQRIHLKKKMKMMVMAKVKKEERKRHSILVV